MPFPPQGQWKFSRTENGVENWKFGSFVKMNIHQMKNLVFGFREEDWQPTDHCICIVISLIYFHWSTEHRVNGPSHACTVRHSEIFNYLLLSNSKI